MLHRTIHEGWTEKGFRSSRQPGRSSADDHGAAPWPDTGRARKAGFPEARRPGLRTDGEGPAGILRVSSTQRTARQLPPSARACQRSQSSHPSPSKSPRASHCRRTESRGPRASGLRCCPAERGGARPCAPATSPASGSGRRRPGHQPRPGKRRARWPPASPMSFARPRPDAAAWPTGGPDRRQPASAARGNPPAAAGARSSRRRGGCRRCAAPARAGPDNGVAPWR